MGAKLSADEIRQWITNAPDMAAKTKAVGVDAEVVLAGQASQRGICSLTSAITWRAVRDEASAVSTEVPKVQYPCASGGETCRRACAGGTG